MDELKDLYNVKELAELLDVLPKTVRKYITDGKITASKFNGGYVITKAEVQRFLEEKGAKI